MDRKQLDELSKKTLSEIDRSELVDLQDVHVDPDLPLAERLEQLLEQIKNPYCFKVGDIVVQVEYADTEKTLEDAVRNYLKSKRDA